MKNIFKLLLFAVLMLLGASVFAQDTLHKVILATADVGARTTYSVVQLIGLSILGISLHWLVDLKKAQSQDLTCTLRHYATSTWVSSAISLILCFIIIMVRHELDTRVPNFTTLEGVIMVGAGYLGDSILPVIFGFAKKQGLDLDSK